VAISGEGSGSASVLYSYHASGEGLKDAFNIFGACSIFYALIWEAKWSRGAFGVREEVGGCFRDGGFSKEETNETKETTEHLVEVLDSLMGCDLGNTCANQ
jgi:hypothetical protein